MVFYTQSASSHFIQLNELEYMTEAIVKQSRVVNLLIKKDHSIQPMYRAVLGPSNSWKYKTHTGLFRKTAIMSRSVKESKKYIIIYTVMDGCMFLNKRPTKMCLAKKKKRRKTNKHRFAQEMDRHHEAII